MIGCVDTDLNMVYFGTGNAVPMAGGEVRGGDNLFTDSVVALDLDSGKLRWHYQLVHHDLWDADIAVSPLLYETKDGKGTKAIAALRPDGYLFLLDRQTGKPIMQVEERPMPQDSFAKTSPTQPYPIGADGILPSCDELSKSAKLPPGYVFGCTFSPVSFNSNVIAPAVGVRVAPMAYSPQTGFFYAAAANGLVSRRRVSEDPYFVAVSGPRIPGLMSYGYFTAIDSRTNKLAWKKALSPAVVGRSGVLSTEGGLVFRAAGDGNVEAYDAQNGENLWRFQIGVGGGPLATYQIDGEEYVALTAGPRVWAFKLKGQVPPISTPVASQTSTVAEGDWFTGPIEETTFIETASMTADIGTLGKRYGLDEHAFSPTRARVKVGARVRWINNGRMIHTVVAHDGSWTTGQMSPAQMVTLVFDKPGTYSYTCKDHPWALAQIIVVPDNEIANPTQATAIPASSANGDNRGFYTVDQARRGQTQYDAQCVGCHADNGGGQATALKGQSFIQNWRGRPLKDLYAKISTTMPRANPGGLSLQTYLDITAYLLQTNDFPSGDRDLTNTPSVFERALTH